MADDHVAKTGARCSQNFRLLELPEAALGKVFFFLDMDCSGEPDQNPLLPLRMECKDFKNALDNNLSSLACFTKVPGDIDDKAAWLARVQEQIRDMLPKWRALRRLRWHFLLPMSYFKDLLEAVATSRPDLQELTLLPDRMPQPDPIPGLVLDWWKSPPHLEPLTSFHGLHTLTIKDLIPFCEFYNDGLPLPALPSLQVLRIENPCPFTLGALPALRELHVSWSRLPGRYYEVKMPHLALSTRLTCVSLRSVEIYPSLQFPGSLESLQLNHAVMKEHGSLHLGKQLVHLTELDLNRVGEYVPVDGPSFSVLMCLARLRTLKLDCTSFRELPDLSAQTRLTSLTLTGFRTAYNLWARTIPFPELAPLTSLRHLEVAKFADKTSLDLHGLSALERLTVDSCEQLKALDGLEDLTRLQTLTLKAMTLLGTGEVKLDALSALKTLVLDSMAPLSGVSLPTSLKRLEYSHFYYCFASEQVQEMFSLPSDVEVVVKPPYPLSP